MPLTGPSILRRCMAMALCCGLTIPLAACSRSATDAPPSSAPSATAGTVAMFVPTDSFTISQNVPLNTWNRLVDATSDALADRGFDDGDVTTHADADLDKQSRSIEDYVHEHIEGNDGGRTLVVAPAVRTAESTKYYGDYATQTLDAARGDEAKADEALRRTADALNRAKKAGAHVVVLSTRIPGFTPDAFVSICDAEQIGRMQAQQLVNKLELDKTSTVNPKRIEIMLPFDGEAAHPGDEQRFARDAFKGVWSVLGTYFRSGVVVSPSLKLSASSTADDWRDVAFEARRSDDAAAEIKSRLHTNVKGAFTPIDGVVSMNDFVADGVIKGLTAMGYVGTAADINPSITIGDVLGNIAGRRDVQRGKVPEPTSAPSGGADKSDDGGRGDGGPAPVTSNRWPIVTGYGSYVSNIPNIVAGKQWMTGLADRNGNAAGIAEICRALDRRDAQAVLGHFNTVDGVPTMALPLVAVSAGNLKTTLIDPGYISLADADL